MICYTEWLEDKKRFFQMFAPVQLMKAGDKGKKIPVKKDVQCLISTIN